MLRNARRVNRFSPAPLAPGRQGGYGCPMVVVTLEPDGKRLEFPRLNTVTRLLGKLGLLSTEVLVIRGRELLTPDRRIGPDDEILIRPVVSRG